jgi:hypothetical protein
MSAATARQEDQVQLEQSNTHLAWKLAKIATGEYWRSAIQGKQQ